MNVLFRKRRQAPAMTLEGVLGPNSRLDDADGMTVVAPEALCEGIDGRLLFSSGTQVLALGRWGEKPEEWARFDAPVTALCRSGGGLVAVALAGGKVVVLDAAGHPLDGWSLPAGRAAGVVDCLFRSETELLVVDCGVAERDSLLAMAAWDAAHKGQVLSLRPSGEVRTAMTGLHYPTGISLDAQGNILVCLLEQAKIVNEAGAVVQSGYPGYLGRLRRTATGYSLACLSRRDPLIEFLKGEPRFIAEMKVKMAPKHWIGPRIDPQFSHDLPIALGATRLFGAVKPWAPSFSYGLVLHLDDKLMPTASAQSRANGRRHAICDTAVWNGNMIAVSRASGELLNLGGNT